MLVDIKLRKKETFKRFYLKNRIRMLEKSHKQWLETKENAPWLNHYFKARQRCNDENDKYYYGKGIRFLLTLDEVKQLWFRDKAYELKKASIDRIENLKNYELSNCRFIEFGENSAKDKRFQILQYSLSGQLIKQWISIQEAGRSLKISPSNIVYTAKGKRKNAGGFIWKYIE